MHKSALFLLPAVLAANHEVSVGAGGAQVFSPTSLTAAVGDTLTFKWASPYHSVAQSTFDEPCEYKDNGIYSGVIEATGGKDFVVTVSDTKPIWIYCSVAKHCQNGMVMVVNPTSDETFDEFKKEAATADSGAQPSTVTGGTFGTGGSSSSVASSASSGSASMMSTASAGSSSAAAATGSMTTSSGASAAATGASTSASASATKGAAMHYAGDAVAALGAAALAVLL